MTSEFKLSGKTILLSLLFALALSITPWPNVISWLQPEWVLLLLIYWSISLPLQFGVGTAWMVGLFQDSLMGTVLGEHAFACALVVYFALQFRLRFRLYPIWQQAMCVLLIILLAKIFIFWVEGLLGRQPALWQFWLPVITSFLIWPVLRTSLDSLLLPDAVVNSD